MRGIVSTSLGRIYTGVDLSKPQILANEHVAQQWDLNPRYIHGDGRVQHLNVGEHDFVLTCPPYHNRERYNAGDGDLSMMKWPDFLTAHRELVERSAEVLATNRFCAWVISDVRDYKGHYRGLPAIAAQHIRDAGLHITNDLILMEPGGLRAKTMRVPWTAARTTTRRHQHIIIAVKGDRREATERIVNAHTQPPA
ncbi:class I SAM-dependent methyltransferase [Corynebacterium phocae]|uniref:class I SAM-dependent methyltransferase n=1 Tax=Corynebacterium phocae TaxID=161895 RepID=UPI00123A569C|nr:class I SAM-dependent methyltransferase [Corynebacterium phocae]KAA8723223.1 hypothetical protein F4V58_07875 [Corynebacterium phocae]